MITNLSHKLLKEFKKTFKIIIKLVSNHRMLYNQIMYRYSIHYMIFGPYLIHISSPTANNVFTVLYSTLLIVQINPII